MFEDLGIALGGVPALGENETSSNFDNAESSIMHYGVNAFDVGATDVGLEQDKFGILDSRGPNRVRIGSIRHMGQRRLGPGDFRLPRNESAQGNELLIALDVLVRAIEFEG